MRLSMLLLADYAAADASGKLNILGAFTIINARQFPVLHPLMYLVMKFQPELGEYGDARQLQVEFLDEDGTKLHEITGEFHVPQLMSGQRPELMEKSIRLRTMGLSPLLR